MFRGRGAQPRAMSEIVAYGTAAVIEREPA
jgi:hypothetical protein